MCQELLYKDKDLIITYKGSDLDNKFIITGELEAIAGNKFTLEQLNLLETILHIPESCEFIPNSIIPETHIIYSKKEAQKYNLKGNLFIEAVEKGNKIIDREEKMVLKNIFS